MATDAYPKVPASFVVKVWIVYRFFEAAPLNWTTRPQVTPLMVVVWHSRTLKSGYSGCSLQSESVRLGSSSWSRVAGVLIGPLSNPIMKRDGGSASLNPGLSV